MTKRIGPSMRVALGFIMQNPGVCAADVDRAVRTARGGHSWMYATVRRLRRAGLVRPGPCQTAPNGIGLYPAERPQ